MTRLDWSIRPRRSPADDVNLVADGGIVYDPGRDRVHYLNHTAVLLLELCTGQVEAAELPRLLQAAYDLPEPPLTDVAGYLEKLLEEGLVH